MPSPEEYVQCFKNFDEDDVELIFEPGRSLVGNSGIIVGRALGVKNERILVSEISMTECIRPG